MKRLLIANRGEIAVRVARTAQERGLYTIAVYSSADRGALHTRVCDLAVEIGPPPAEASYLNIAALIEAAKKTQADSVHPGYGFLSENPQFAEAVEAAGMRWIGPPAQAMRTMGAKISAREAMIAAGVPVVPGFQGQHADDTALEHEAARLGFPVLVKASAGGGGKGMRRVERPGDLRSALEGARREALSAFGDAAIYLESAIERPRHIEMQIFGDTAGRVVALGERECSIQRRHQKIVEEAPAPSLDAETRSRMTAAAVAAGSAVGYVGAGTVEFLLAQDGRFYFLEMNTRLQVEHPVTEETLGLDLVAAQLDVAEGKPIRAEWEQRGFRGHAIECRVYAEDPVSFLPRTGTILVCEEPSGPGVRVDSGIEQGSTVGIDYDPLLAKLIVHAEDRPSAVARMRRALSHYVILGVTTNLELLRRIVGSDDFARERIDTAFLSRLPKRAPRRPPAAAVLAAAFAVGSTGPSGEGPDHRRGPDPWHVASGWRSR
jgi:acetyl/propionyl-CoA carboxylase alpha subunit